MMIFKRWSWEQWLLAATAAAAGLGSLLDLLINAQWWDANRTVHIVLALLAAFVFASIVQSTRIAQAVEDLGVDIGRARVRFLNMEREVPNEWEQTISRTNELVREAVLSWVDGALDQTGRDRYRNLRDQRVKSRNVRLHQVAIIHDNNRTHFEEVLGMIERFGDDARYELRYFHPSQTPTPAINLWAFDDEDVYVGSLYLYEASKTSNTMLHVKDGELGQWLLLYWDALWREATWLKRGSQVNEPVLEGIRARLGIPSDEYDSMRENARRARLNGHWENAKLREQ